MFCELGRRHVVLHLHDLRSFQLALHVLHLFAVSFLAENLAGASAGKLFGTHSVRSPCRSYRTVFPSSTGLFVLFTFIPDAGAIFASSTTAC